MRRLKTVRRPPIYPNGAQAIPPVAPSPFPRPHAVLRCPSVDSGLGTPDEDQHGREGPPAGITFVGRLCRTLKYEEVSLEANANATLAPKELGVYPRFYKDQRLHLALGYCTPAEVFYDDSPLR